MVIRVHVFQLRPINFQAKGDLIVHDSLAVSLVATGGDFDFFVCFFFQAEDGIRDVAVTGVQTCALPIWTGRGQRVETSLLRGVLALQSGLAVDYPGKPVLMRENPTYRLYQGSDGEWFFVACGNQSFWGKLCTAVGIEHLRDDPRFASWLLRVQNNADLLPLLEKAFNSRTRAEWLDILAAHDIPAAPVKSLLEFMDDPGVKHQDMVHEYDHPEVGRLRLMGQPLVFDDTPTRDPGPPPTLGQHTDDVLRQAGYDAAAIEKLRAARVVR